MFFPNPRKPGEDDCTGLEGAIPPDNPAVINQGLTHLVIYALSRIQQCVMSISISVVVKGYGNLYTPAIKANLNFRISVVDMAKPMHDIIGSVMELARGFS